MLWAWLAHGKTRGSECGEGVFERAVNAQRGRKKASQQNYKPEKISVQQHWEQNGFCFLQDNELTRAHRTERNNPCGCKCYHWWNDAIFFSHCGFNVSAWLIDSEYSWPSGSLAVWHFPKKQRWVWVWTSVCLVAESSLTRQGTCTSSFDTFCPWTGSPSL